MAGPLTGYKVLEFAGLGPGPFCAMMLADMGAEVIRIDRHSAAFSGTGRTIVERGRRTISMNIKATGAHDVVMKLIQNTDVLIEGYRPGVMERLGYGPEVCLEANPALVYGRMTGWGQTGPLAQTAGHDLNYIAITGALHAMGYKDRPPTPPLHVVGDLGAGAMSLAFGIVCALLERSKSDQGQVIDAAISDAASTLVTPYHGMMTNGRWNPERQSNLLDGAAHFYACYACADGKFISVGAIEPQFYQAFRDILDLTDPDFDDQWDTARWPLLTKKLTTLFLTRTRDEWWARFQGSDACVAPVLSFEEAQQFAHHTERHGFTQTNGAIHPAPSPKFSRTPGQARPMAEKAGAHTLDILQGLGLNEKDIQTLHQAGVI